MCVKSVWNDSCGVMSENVYNYNAFSVWNYLQDQCHDFFFDGVTFKYFLVSQECVVDLKDRRNICKNIVHGQFREGVWRSHIHFFIRDIFGLEEAFQNLAFRANIRCVYNDLWQIFTCNIRCRQCASSYPAEKTVHWVLSCFRKAGTFQKVYFRFLLSPDNYRSERVVKN